MIVLVKNLGSHLSELHARWVVVEVVESDGTVVVLAVSVTVVVTVVVIMVVAVVIVLVMLAVVVAVTSLRSQTPSAPGIPFVIHAKPSSQTVANCSGKLGLQASPSATTCAIKEHVPAPPAGKHSSPASQPTANSLGRVGLQFSPTDASVGFVFVVVPVVVVVAAIVVTSVSNAAPHVQTLRQPVTSFLNLW